MSDVQGPHPVMAVEGHIIASSGSGHAHLLDGGAQVGRVVVQALASRR